MNNFIEYEDIYTIHPGYYILEYLDEFSMNAKKLSEKMQISEKTVSLLINGKRDLNIEYCKKLFYIFDTSCELCLNLQSNYDKNIAKIKEMKNLEKDNDIYSKIDKSYFKKYKIIDFNKYSKKYDKIEALKKQLKIPNLELLENNNMVCNFKQDKVNNIISTNVFLQIILNFYHLSNKLEIIYNEDDWNKMIINLKNTILKKYDDIEQRILEIKYILNSIGINFILLPSYKNSGVKGMTHWINKGNVILALTDKGKSLNQFYFNLFHELGHIKDGYSKNAYMKYDKEDINDVEKRANTYARNILIIEGKYNEFVKKPISNYNIKKFAMENNVLEGILIERLQFDGYIGRNQFNSLKENKYELNEIYF